MNDTSYGWFSESVFATLSTPVTLKLKVPTLAVLIGVPFAAEYPRLGAYFERLLARPSFARTLAEARPYFSSFPYRERMPARFLGQQA